MVRFPVRKNLPLNRTEPDLDTTRYGAAIMTIPEEATTAPGAKRGVNNPGHGAY
jgi:hypothetical protein